MNDGFNAFTEDIQESAEAGKEAHVSRKPTYGYPAGDLRVYWIKGKLKSYDKSGIYIDYTGTTVKEGR